MEIAIVQSLMGPVPSLFGAPVSAEETATMMDLRRSATIVAIGFFWAQSIFRSDGALVFIIQHEH